MCGAWDSTAKSTDLLLRQGTASSDTGCPKYGPSRHRNTVLKALWTPLMSRTHQIYEKTHLYPCNSLPESPGMALLLTMFPTQHRTNASSADPTAQEQNLVSVEVQNNFWKVGCLHLFRIIQTIRWDSNSTLGSNGNLRLTIFSRHILWFPLKISSSTATKRLH